MRRIFVERYAYASSGPSLPAKASPTLTRRMSWMQKAAMEALETIKPLPLDAPLYFATQYGEVDATLAVAASILSRQLPVSPTAFQHSVHNAVPGYLTIASGSRSPSLTVSSGFASFDKILFWAAHELNADLIDKVIVAQAFERLPSPVADDPEIAACELLLLTTSPTQAPQRELQSIVRLTSQSMLEEALQQRGSEVTQTFHETAARAVATPLRLDSFAGNFLRITESFGVESASARNFEAYVSKWNLVV